MINYFELLNLPVNYQLSLNELENKFQDCAIHYHPDNVASLSVFEKKQYMQMFTTLNEAYSTLKDPVLRAEYFLILNQVGYDKECTIQSDPEFLEEQIILREKIADNNTTEDLLLIATSIQANLSLLFQEIAHRIQQQHWNDVIKLIDKTKFFKQLLLATEQKQNMLKQE